MRTYLKAGFSQKEAATAILDKKRGEVTMLDTDEKTVVRPDGSIISDIFHICFLHYFAM